jgi:putative flippase GtrA
MGAAPPAEGALVRNYLRTFANRETARQFVSVGVIGALNTVVDFGLFNVLRAVDIPRNWAITVAFATATFVSYLLNRRVSFRLTDGKVSLRETVHFYAINVAAWAVTLLVVEVADALYGPLSILGENVAKVAAVVIVLIPKFAGYRDIVFRRALDDARASDTAKRS